MYLPSINPREENSYADGSPISLSIPCTTINSKIIFFRPSLSLTVLLVVVLSFVDGTDAFHPMSIYELSSTKSIGKTMATTVSTAGTSSSTWPSTSKSSSVIKKTIGMKGTSSVFALGASVSPSPDVFDNASSNNTDVAILDFERLHQDIIPSSFSESTIVATAADTVAETTLVTSSSTITTTTPTTTTTTTTTGGTMDATIYTFNKALIDSVYKCICFLYPVKGTERDYARFYVLETVARVPYFAYLSVMHLRETFGVRYNTMSDRMRTHYAEADNELHHLLIMESLGGNDSPIDRAVAQTAAFLYYWYVVALYCVNEPAAYHLSELIEDHAYHTYDGFLTEHESMLRTMAVPDIARKYYERDNPFLFDLFCTVRSKEQPPPGGADDDVDDNAEGMSNSDAVAKCYSQRRRPKLETLYDVFCNIRDDEKEHWKTLCNLVQFDDMNAVDEADVTSTRPAVTVTSPPP